MCKEIILIIGMALLPAVALWGNTVSIQPGPDIGQDTYVNRDSPNYNFSDGVIMYTLTGIDRAFLQFPQLSQYLGYQVTSATLELYLFAEWGKKWFCRVLEPWDEDIVTWNNQPAYSYTDYLEFIVEQESIGSWDFDVTGMVNKWLSGEWENYGWAFTSGWDEMGIYTSNSANRPKLVLEGNDLPPLSVQPISLGKLKSLYSP